MFHFRIFLISFAFLPQRRGSRTRSRLPTIFDTIILVFSISFSDTRWTPTFSQRSRALTRPACEAAAALRGSSATYSTLERTLAAVSMIGPDSAWKIVQFRQLDEILRPQYVCVAVPSKVWTSSSWRRNARWKKPCGSSYYKSAEFDESRLTFDWAACAMGQTDFPVALGVDEVLSQRCHEEDFWKKPKKFGKNLAKILAKILANFANNLSIF